MKTVSGKVVSSQSISLSKAAKYLATFSGSDNEVSPAFSAYLKRTTTAFNELAQLHKKYKNPLGRAKANEDHSGGVVTQGTSIHGNSEGRKCEGRDRDGSQAGLSIHKASKNRNDEVEERHHAGSFQIDDSMNTSRHNANRNAADVGGDGKKSKKRSKLGIENVVDQPDGDHGAINVVEVKSEMGSIDGSENVKKEKKKNRDKPKTQNNDLVPGKEVQRADGVAHHEADTELDIGVAQKKYKKKSKTRDEQEIRDNSHAEQKHYGNTKNTVNEEKEHSNITEMSSEDLNKKKKRRYNHGKESSDTALEIEMQQADGVGHVASTQQNSSDTQKKHKKNRMIREDDVNMKKEVKEEMEQSGMKSAEQRSVVATGNIDEVSDQKHKKKRSREQEEREPGLNIETRAAEKKASKKRKYEVVADGGLDASREALGKKKKKDEH